MSARVKKPKPRQAPRRATKQPARAKLPRVVVVGFGRAGGAVALGLKAAGYPVSALPRSAESVRRAAAHRVPLASHDELLEAQLCLLAVPDGVVTRVAQSLEEDLSPDCALVHLSGALPLTVLREGAPLRGRAVGSLHPLAAISSLEDDLTGHSGAIAGTTAPLRAQLTAMAKALGLTPIEVPETGRAAYHAGAVLSAGLLVALADGAVSALQEAGLDRETALKALLPLMGSALRGASQRGLDKGLTGPVVRGDVAVVQAHLDALPADVGALYRILSRRALALASGLPVETRLALERTLA